MLRLPPETCEKAITTFKDVLLRLTTKLPQGIGSVRTFQSLMTDKKAGLKADSKATAVKEDAELVFSLARLMGLIDDTFEGSSLDVLILAHERAGATKSNAAIATAAAPATAPAANTPTAAPPASGSGHDKSGLQSENDNRYDITRVLKSKATKDAKKETEAAEKKKAIDAAAAEARKLEQIEAAENKAKLERIRKADANHLRFSRIGKAEHQAAVMDEQFEALRKKLKVLNAKLSEEKIVPIFEPVKHMSANGYSTTSLSARPSFMEMMRILTTEGGVKPNQLNLVCNIVYAAFFEKQCEDKLPSVPCMVDWFDDLGEKDCELMIDFMTGVSAEWAVHIMSDSSRRSKAERHGVVCAMWDARTTMPLKCVAGLGTVDSCAGQDKAKVTYKILEAKGVKFEFTPQSGWSFVRSPMRPLLHSRRWCM